MSMFSPAERDVPIRLPSLSSSRSRIVRMRRSSSTSMSRGTSANSARRSSGSGAAVGVGIVGCALAAHQTNSVLAQLVHRGHYPGVSLVIALQHDHVRKLSGDIDV